MKTYGRNSTALGFIVPIVTENLINTVITMVVAGIIGGISGTSLTVMTQGNRIVTLIAALFTLETTGACTLCSRMVGARDYKQASHTLQQTLELTAVCALAVAALCFAFARPIIDLLMPSASEAALTEGVTFFRLLSGSVPFLMVSNVCVNGLRAAGRGVNSLAVAGANLLVQLVLAILLIGKYDLGITGAGLAYLGCRSAGCIVAIICLFSKHTPYELNFRKIKPDPRTLKRLVRVGMPPTFENFFIQVGYLLANTMAIGLGEFEAASFTIVSTLWDYESFAYLAISVLAPTMVGNLIGAGEFEKARKTGAKLLAAAVGITVLLAAIVQILGTGVTSLYAAGNAAVAEDAAGLLWITFIGLIPGAMLNAVDPQLRVGGDVKFVMIVSMLAVWLIRLPLSWLFSYKLGMGAFGILLANCIALIVRAVCDTARFINGKYLRIKV